MSDDEFPPQYSRPNDIVSARPIDSVPLSDVARARALVKQLRQVDEEALRLYEPLSYQERFHSCRAKEAILLKANQVGGPTPLDTPVLTPTGWVPIGSLRVGDRVVGGDGNPCNVVSVTFRGMLPVFKLTFDDGASIRCSEDHFWTCKLRSTGDQWVVRSLRDIREYGGDDPVPGDRAVIPVAKCKMDKQPVAGSPYAIGMAIGFHEVNGLPQTELSIPQEYINNTADVRVDVLCGLMDTAIVHVRNDCLCFCLWSKRLCEDVMAIVRSLGCKASLRWDDMHGGEVCVRSLTTPSVGRILQTIRPDGNAECVCIGVDFQDHTYVTKDYIVTHNTLSTCAEIARAVTGQDPHNKYPKKDGIAVCVGYGEKHIGTTFFKKLFKRGAFKIIRDLHTGNWRTFRPWPDAKVVDGKPGDLSREKEALPAPPLIPKRFIDGKISWVRKSEDIFSRVKFTTGWELYAANSAGDPEHLQGLTGVWLYVFDEDVAQSGWYEEAVLRTSAVNGYLRWNAMPHSKTNDIRTLVERGEEEEDKPNPQTVVVRVEQRENPYLSDAAKEQNARIARSMGEDVYRKRILGELTIGESLMYPGFSKVIHGARTELNEADQALEDAGKIIRSGLQKAYASAKFRVPETWTRRTCTDPGHTVCATLFSATPPPEVGEFVLIYKELYITKNTAKIWGQRFREAIGDDVIEEMLFDMHGGHLRGADDRMWIHEYQDALEENKIRCEATGSRFRAGCDKIAFREEQVRKWLEIRDVCREAGFPTVYIDIENCPNLVREIQHFKKKTVKQGGIDVVIDEGNRRGAVHAVECFCDKTEVLTASGWKAFKSISAGEPLGTVNLATNKIEYQVPSRIIEKPYSGDMLKFGGLKMDAMVTPHHRMVAYSRYDRDVPFFIDAEDLRINTDVLKLSAQWDGEELEMATIPEVWMGHGRHLQYRIEAEKEIDPLILAEFLGWYVSEGCVETNGRCRQNKNRVTISQSISANPGKWSRIQWLLDQLPWKHYDSKDGFVISSKQLHDYLLPLGTAYTKKVPDWMRSATPSVISAFLSAAVSGDGWIDGSGHRRYASASKELVDGIQELFLKIGSTGSVICVPKSTRTNTIRGKVVQATCDMYWFCEWGYKIAGLRDSSSKPNFGPEKYDGMVYCATVPNGTLITRRNGKPLISGNCIEYLAAHGCRYVKPRPRPKYMSRIDAVLAEKSKRRNRIRMSRLGRGSEDTTITLGAQGSTK